MISPLGLESRIGLTISSYDDIMRLKNGQRELGARACNDDSFDGSTDNARGMYRCESKDRYHTLLAPEVF